MIQQSSELKTDVLKHGTRVRLTIDMPDDTFPLFKGDEGTIFDNATLDGSEHWKGFTSDRYDGTHVSRKDENHKTYLIVDFCEPIDDVKDGLYPVVSLLVGAKYILEPLTHNNGCFRADFALLENCLKFISAEVSSWGKKTTRKLVKKLETLIDEIEQSIIISESTLDESQKDSLARVENLLCTAWELCLENRLSEELRAPALSRDGKLEYMQTSEFQAWAIENEESAIFGDGQ